ncbi:MAG: hypothetical protein EBS07_03480 [Sphingobacteriia bacterium]|nr:hypothetical protein [Sphingobacteriia bacterium]
MRIIIQNGVALIVGLVLGSFINMGIIMLGGNIIPPPPGTDITTEEGLKASMHLFGIEHFVFPFLAHALGTFAGALFAFWVAKSYRLFFALIIGFVFLLGGTYMVFVLPSPIGFNIIDLVFAYIPMAYLATRCVPVKINK